MEHYRDRAEREGFDPHKYGSHVVLLGWSNARDKPLGMVACRQDGGDSFVGGEIATFSIGPDPGHPVSDVPDLQVMQSLAREQVSKVWHDHPGEPIGGRLLLAEVRCAQMAIRELATLG